MRPIVFIPGFMLDRDLWSDVTPLLTDVADHIHPDFRDAGSIPDMADIALRAAPSRFNVVGFSMGGYAARDIARRVPDRIESLVLVGSSARGDTKQQHRAKVNAAILLEAGDFRGVARDSIRQILAPDREEDDALVERVRDMGIRLGGDVYRRQLRFPRDTDAHLLDQISCPTLVIAGTDDRLRSMQEAEELRDGIPGAEMATLPTGHMIPMEAPETLASLILEFIAA